MFRRWWFWLLASIALLTAILAGAGFLLARRIEPLVRQKTIQYLRERFNADVEIGRLDASLQGTSAWKVILNRGKDAVVHAWGEQIRLWAIGRHDLPPVVDLARFDFEFDLRTLWRWPVNIHYLKLEDVAMTVPPGGFCPVACPGNRKDLPTVRIHEIIADGSTLTIPPEKAGKRPMVFQLHSLRLFDVGGPQHPIRYEACLTNPVPPGRIVSSGTFGPLRAAQLSATPVRGTYIFNNADLGVFKGIAGTLSSRGKFSGIVERIVVDGTTETPDFRLTRSGNPVMLHTSFHAIVNGTDGDTLLQPVKALLGSTGFECRGAITRSEGKNGKTLVLDVNLTRGRIDDFLRLAMKEKIPIMRGGMKLQMKLELPPGKGAIADRMQVSGSFRLRDTRFTSATLQEKIDALSRRGQGCPGNFDVEEVQSDLDGDFLMHLGRIRFQRLRFTVPGSEALLTGRYIIDTDMLDLHGKLRLEAGISDTMTGLKHWLLKPLDPFFAKDGAGTVLSIAVSGPPSSPTFGRDHSR